MALTLSSRTITAVAAVAAVLAAPLTAASQPREASQARLARQAREVRQVVPDAPVAKGAPAGRGAAVTVRQQLAVARYWTPARMRAAVRDERSAGDTLGKGLRWARAGAVARTTGKVFFTADGTDYVCSGSAVDSAGQDLVLTAAHCTGNGADDRAANWIFVPGYNDGSRPYGTYTAHQFYVSPQWSGLNGASVTAEKYDVAFVAVNPAVGGDGAGRRLEEVTGGLRVAFGGSLNRQSTYVFGYPSDPPFTGLYPNYCAGQARQTAQDAANGSASLPCAMTAGDSGGPWLAGFSPRAGTGTIVGISTYKYDDGAGTLYGTALGPDARALYRAASRDR